MCRDLCLWCFRWCCWGVGDVWAAPQTGQTYLFEFTGSDGNNGLSEGAPFATVNKVTGLNLQPDTGFQVRRRGTPTADHRSGVSGSLITFERTRSVASTSLCCPAPAQLSADAVKR